MRKFELDQPPFSVNGAPQQIQYLVEQIRKISEASQDQVTEEIADAYEVSNLTKTRTLDPTTATVADVANVLGTLIQDMKDRGKNQR